VCSDGFSKDAIKRDILGGKGNASHVIGARARTTKHRRSSWTCCLEPALFASARARPHTSRSTRWSSLRKDDPYSLVQNICAQLDESQLKTTKSMQPCHVCPPWWTARKAHAESASASVGQACFRCQPACWSCIGSRFTSLLGWRMRNWGCANADRIHANPFSLRISANCESDPQAREWMAVRFAQYQQALHILVGFARIRSVCESMRIANRQPSFSGPTLDYGWTRDGRGIFQNRSVQYNFEEFLPLHLF